MATDLGLQMTLARQLLAAGQTEKAVPMLERVVGADRARSSRWRMLADAHRSLGQFDRAASALEQAAESNPRYYLALGDVYERQDKWEEAAAAYEKGSANVRGPGRELRLRRAAALLNIPDGAGAERAIAAAHRVPRRPIRKTSRPLPAARRRTSSAATRREADRGRRAGAGHRAGQPAGR